MTEVYRVEWDENQEQAFVNLLEGVEKLAVEHGKPKPVRPGAVFATVACTFAVEPVLATAMLGKHIARMDLTEEEEILFGEVDRTGEGRYLSKWGVPPMMTMRPDGTLVMLNAHAIGQRIVFMTDAQQTRTVMCLESEVPKAGLLGTGDERVLEPEDRDAWLLEHPEHPLNQFPEDERPM